MTFPVHHRKAYRLGKWLGDLNALRNTPVFTKLGVFEILANGGEGVYYFVEQLTWYVLLLCHRYVHQAYAMRAAPAALHRHVHVSVRRQIADGTYQQCSLSGQYKHPPAHNVTCLASWALIACANMTKDIRHTWGKASHTNAFLAGWSKLAWWTRSMQSVLASSVLGQS